jgi:hypothetical protein
VVINLGKAQVLKRHVPQPRDRFVGRDGAAADLLEEFVEIGGIHDSEIPTLSEANGEGILF